MAMLHLCLLLSVLAAPDTQGHRRKKSYRYNCRVTVFYDKTFVSKVNGRLSPKTNKEAEMNTMELAKKVFGHLNGFYKKNFLDAIGGYVQLKLGSQEFLDPFLVEEKTITSNMINSYMAKKVDNECLNLLLTDSPVYSSKKNVDVQGFTQPGKICSNAKWFSNPLKLASLNGRRSLASHLFVVSTYDLSLELERHHERLALYVQHESAHTMAAIHEDRYDKEKRCDEEPSVMSGDPEVLERSRGYMSSCSRNTIGTHLHAVINGKLDGIPGCLEKTRPRGKRRKEDGEKNGKGRKESTKPNGETRQPKRSGESSESEEEEDDDSSKEEVKKEEVKRPERKVVIEEGESDKVPHNSRRKHRREEGGKGEGARQVRGSDKVRTYTYIDGGKSRREDKGGRRS